MKLKLIYGSTVSLFDKPHNKDFDKALVLLKNEMHHYAKVEIIEAEKISNEERYNIYSQACVPSSVRGKFRLRQVFGTKRKSGRFFGKGVPALLVYENDIEYPVSVYPHEKNGKTTTIKEFLETLKK